MLEPKRLLFISLVLLLVLSGSYWYFSSPTYDDHPPNRAKNRPNPIRLLNTVPFPEKEFLEQEKTELSALDKQLRDRLEAKGVKPLKPARNFKPAKLRLGRWLFWEKELSGTRRISCGQCHDITLGNSDGLSLSLGPSALGDSIGRQLGPEGEFSPRNSLHIFNPTQPEVKSFFWDKRISKSPDGSFHTPAGDKLPEGMDNFLAIQALFPMVTNADFKGRPGSRDVFGLENRIANQPDTAFRKIWDLVLDRLLKHETYRQYFVKAFPIDNPDQISIKHVGMAIAAFEEAAFTLRDSPWNRYLMGYNGALSPRQKKGAQLFFGKANCSNCHSGRILSDQKTYNIAVPQLGPGVPPHEPYDLGRFTVTGNPEDKFAFRTPSLHNVSITGPWMHNGAYKSLEGAVRHHINPEQSLRNYDKHQLGRDIQKYHRSPNWENQLEQFPMGLGKELIPTVRDNPRTINRILKTIDREIQAVPELTDQEFDQLMYFLFSLTSRAYVMGKYRNQNHRGAKLTQEHRKRTARMNLYNQSTVPDTTPSGIPPVCNTRWCMDEIPPPPQNP